jgi:hypothetical protein
MCNMLFSAFLCDTKVVSCTGHLAEESSQQETLLLQFLQPTEECPDSTDPITESVLVMDDRVLCEEAAHITLQSFSIVLIGK